jgi:hypothetical protein
LEGEELEEEEYGDIEWRSFGADLLRLQIGRWSIAQGYPGQFRVKVSYCNTDSDTLGC